MTYNIVCVSDYNYIQHAAVMLCSLFENNPHLSFSIYFLTDESSYEKISSNHIEDNMTISEALNKLCNKYGASLAVCPCSLEGIKDLPVGQWSTFMYLKLFIPQVLPIKEDRCLFLDVDMIINDDISSLYDIHLGNNVIAAAEDIPDCVKFKHRLKLNDSDVYINSGVMVCNLREWRKMQSQKDIFDYTRSIASSIQNEQDVIACYFKEKIKLLPIRWNMVTFYFMQSPKIFDHYLPQLKKARKNPGIIHFAAPIKPWFKDCKHPYRYLYKKYLSKTLWKKIEKFPTYENLSIKKRINSTMKYCLCKVGLRKDPFYLSK